MSQNKLVRVGFMLAVAALASAACSTRPRGAQPATVSPGNMPSIGTVDERFQSYNIEMVAVTGGRFWKPYRKEAEADREAHSSAARTKSNAPAGMNADMFEYLPPIDLSNPRLRKLAAALGPSYVRVSGTWANTTYFQDSDAPAPAKPPKGFNGVLTRKEWKGVVEFARAVDAKIVTSFAVSAGTRNAAGVWTPRQARKILAYTRSIGGQIEAAEFMNEPNFAAVGGAPKGYDAASYARDFAVFRSFIRKAAPGLLILGPGSVGEGLTLVPPAMTMIHSTDLLAAVGPAFDVFSYHFYGAVSQRCAGLGAAGQTTSEAALSEQWLSRADTVEAFYAGLRDKFEPGRPIWITETADAACGGNPWGSTFLDTFRYLDQHARLARRGVKVMMHNTLASSDYGLLDRKTLTPRPNFWAALLWRKLMGTTVLNPGPPASSGLHLYAQCLRDHPGGVALLAINTDRARSHGITVSDPAYRYTLTAQHLQDTVIQLNGSTLALQGDGDLPELNGEPEPAGRVSFAPASITFLAVPDARNRSCH